LKKFINLTQTEIEHNRAYYMKF